MLEQVLAEGYALLQRFRKVFGTQPGRPRSLAGEGPCQYAPIARRVGQRDHRGSSPRQSGADYGVV
ncbi:hypothetical protein NITHO_2910002 [Nitrolancea hollandica Lb]|uniref:Uncharacterized protein n=1 Tax=Nitrolancea hollandica Lb TaxID=1129897 RepID=I4EGZ6_9BACT|nr:hypothetical protein NITHO_2910002 [Nitrolancea hollandica Lb]